MSLQFTYPRAIRLNAAGTPYAGSQAYFYAAGSLNDQSVYQDFACTLAHAQPVVADDNGYFAPIYLNPNAAADYRFILKSSTGALLDDVDDIPKTELTVEDLRAELYVLTALEQSVGITSVDSTYPPSDLRRYGAVGDGVTDDTAALRKAALLGGRISAPGGLTYLITQEITLAVEATVVDLQGSTVKFSSGFSGTSGRMCAFRVTAEGCLIQNTKFDGSAASTATNQNLFITFTAAASNGTVRDCAFTGLATGASDLQCAVSFLTGSDYGEVSSCRFDDCPGAAFSQGARPRFHDCTVLNPKDVSFALNGSACIGGSVLGCKIYSGDVVISGHILAEEGASNWTIADNYVYGGKGTSIGAVSPSYTTVVNGGLICNNIVDGGGFTSAAPCALIAVTAYYSGSVISNNTLRGMAAGLSSNTAISIPTKNTTLRGNVIDCTAGASALQAVLINVAGGWCDIIENRLDCTGGPTHHFLVSNGDNSSQRILFKGGSYTGGTDVINTDVSDPTNCPIYIENLGETTATNVLALTAADDIALFFNSYNAIKWPHSIKAQRVLYGNGAPTNGAWARGDKVWNAAPSAAGVPGWICVTAGSPGTWKTMAVLAA